MSILRKDYRHSASRGNAFIDSPAHWIITELYGYRELPNPRMLMGLAAESAAMEGLKLDLSEDKVREQAAKDFDTLYSFGKVVSYQNEKIVNEKGLNYPIKCITDFEFDNVIIDTKATAYLKRLKSGKLDANWYPKDSDVRQQLLYKRVFNKPTGLLYSSAKDQEGIDMLDRVASIDIIQVFHTMEYVCSIAKSKEDVVKMFPLTMDNFRWGKGMTDIKEFATDVWNKVWKI